MIAAQAVLLALALSLDSLGTGVAYGMRRLTLPASTYALLAAATATMMTFSMLAGASLVGPGDAVLASALGRTALLGVGLWQIHRGWRQYLGIMTREAPGQPLATFRLVPLGVLVQVLHDPTRADLDSSGRLDMGESTLLGLALGLVGTALGRRIATGWLSRRGFALPGLIICAIALLRKPH